MGKRQAASTGATRRAPKSVKFSSRLPELLFAQLQRQASEPGADLTKVLVRNLEASLNGGSQTDHRLAAIESQVGELVRASQASREHNVWEAVDRGAARTFDMLNLQATTIDEITKSRELLVQAFAAIKSALLVLEEQIQQRRS